MVLRIDWFIREEMETLAQCFKLPLGLDSGQDFLAHESDDFRAPASYQVGPFIYEETLATVEIPGFAPECERPHWCVN